MSYLVKKKSDTPYDAEHLFVFDDVRKFEKWLSENTNMSDGHVEDLLEELTQTGISTVYADFDYLDSTPGKPPAYNDLLNPEQQIAMEEKIASLIFDNTTSNEEVSAKLGRQILLEVLTEFRPDFVEKRT
jgi:hypothetical protein